MIKKSSIFYSALILTGVNLLLRFVSTTFQVYLSSKIGAEGIGLVQLVLSVGGMALTAGLAGIRTATMYLTAAQLGIKKPDRIAHTLSACFFYSILCSSTIAIVLSIFARQIATGWIGNADTVSSIRTYAAFLPVSCLCAVMTGYFTASGKIKTLAAVEVIEQIVSIVITMSLLIFWAKNDMHLAAQSMILGSGMGACVTLTVLVFLRVREKAPSGKPFPIWTKLLSTAVPLAIADDLKSGINTIENLMVPKRLYLYAAIASPLAAYGTVCGMVFPILMFPAAIVFSLAELLIPEIARNNAANKKMRIKHLTKRSLRLILLYGCICGGILYICASVLCQKLYQSTDAGNHLRMYAFLSPMLYCDIIIDAINKGLGKQKISVQFNLLTAILDVIFLYLLLPCYGMTGYFVSFVITHLLNFILSLRLLTRTAAIKTDYKMPIITVLSTLFAAGLSLLLSDLLVQLISYFLLLSSLLTLTGIITRKDILWLKSLISFIPIL